MTLRRYEVEAWVLRIVEDVLARRLSEDHVVELKTDWPGDWPKAARRIAAHANSARQQPILWIIGLDEKARAHRWSVAAFGFQRMSSAGSSRKRSRLPPPHSQDAVERNEVKGVRSEVGSDGRLLFSLAQYHPLSLPTSDLTPFARAEKRAYWEELL